MLFQSKYQGLRYEGQRLYFNDKTNFTFALNPLTLSFFRENPPQ